MESNIRKISYWLRHGGNADLQGKISEEGSRAPRDRPVAIYTFECVKQALGDTVFDAFKALCNPRDHGKWKKSLREDLDNQRMSTVPFAKRCESCSFQDGSIEPIMANYYYDGASKIANRTRFKIPNFAADNIDTTRAAAEMLRDLPGLVEFFFLLHDLRHDMTAGQAHRFADRVGGMDDTVHQLHRGVSDVLGPIILEVSKYYVTYKLAPKETRVNPSERELDEACGVLAAILQNHGEGWIQVQDTLITAQKNRVTKTLRVLHSNATLYSIAVISATWNAATAYSLLFSDVLPTRNLRRSMGAMASVHLAFRAVRGWDEWRQRSGGTERALLAMRSTLESLAMQIAYRHSPMSEDPNIDFLLRLDSDGYIMVVVLGGLSLIAYAYKARNRSMLKDLRDAMVYMAAPFAIHYLVVITAYLYSDLSGRSPIEQFTGSTRTETLKMIADDVWNRPHADRTGYVGWPASLPTIPEAMGLWSHAFRHIMQLMTSVSDYAPLGPFYPNWRPEIPWHEAISSITVFKNRMLQIAGQITDEGLSAEYNRLVNNSAISDMLSYIMKLLLSSEDMTAFNVTKKSVTGNTLSLRVFGKTIFDHFKTVDPTQRNAVFYMIRLFLCSLQDYLRDPRALESLRIYMANHGAHPENIRLVENLLYDENVQRYFMQEGAVADFLT